MAPIHRPNAAKVLSRQETLVSPWVRLISKEIEFVPGHKADVYHCLAQSDYVVMLVRTITSGLYPLVQQYRPAVEAYTWELPAGLLNDGESPRETCERELMEETGLQAVHISYLGSYSPDTGRLENKLHAFYVTALDPKPESIACEDGITVAYVNMETLKDYILKGQFQNQLHIALLTLAMINGFED